MLKRKMTHYSLNLKIIELFNTGAKWLYPPMPQKLGYYPCDCDDLFIDGYTIIVSMIIDKAQGTNQEKYIQVRRKCVSLFKHIRDKRVIEYFTPKVLLLNWKNL